MEIRQFEYFSAIVRAGSISAAARVLHVSQPALSKQVAALEHELGVGLLERIHDGVRPTDAGRIFVQRAEFLLDYLDETRTVLRAADVQLSGPLHVGVSPSLMPELARRLTGDFAARHPRLELHLTEGLPMFLSEWIDAGRGDVGIFTRWPADDRADRLAYIDLALDEILIVAAPDAGLDPAVDLLSGDLRRAPLALTPGMRHLLAEGLGVGPGDLPGVEIDSIHSVRNLVVTEQYRAALPYAFVRQDLARGALAAARLAPPVHRQVVAATKLGRRRSAAIDAVVGFVRSHLQALPRLGKAPEGDRES